MVIITEKNPPASSFNSYSDGDGIFGLASVIIPDNTTKVCSFDSLN